MGAPTTKGWGAVGDATIILPISVRRIDVFASTLHQYPSQPPTSTIDDNSPYQLILLCLCLPLGYTRGEFSPMVHFGLKLRFSARCRVVEWRKTHLVTLSKAKDLYLA